MTSHTLASSAAFSSAISVLLTLLGCPLPMPRRRPSLATVMALLFTCFTMRQAKRRSSSCCSVGFVSETGMKSISSGLRESACWYSHPPA